MVEAKNKLNKISRKFVHDLHKDIDSLGFFTIVLNIYFAVYWSIAYFPRYLTDLYVPELLIALALFGVAFPRLKEVLLINTMLFILYYIDVSPSNSNNTITAFFLCLVTIISYLTVNFTTKPHLNHRDEIFRLIKGPGKLILVTMYFYGIYHKLNLDFLNTDVSCAVALYKPLASYVGLENNQVGHLFAVYITFVVEGVAILGLLITKYRTLGLAVGIPFHIAIGFTGYAFYMDFSTIVLAMYALSVNNESLNRFNTWLKEILRSHWKINLISKIRQFAALGFLIFVLIHNRKFSAEEFMPIFALYSIPLYLFLTLFVKNEKGEHSLSKSGLIYIIPFIYFINGSSPYIGLKTESSIAMYSNLHVEARQTNHLIHGVIPGFWNYSEEVITIVSSEYKIFRPGENLVRYEFDKRLSRHPNVDIEVRSNFDNLIQKISPSNDNWVNTYTEAPWFIKKFLVFKPVDFNRPKVCTH